VADTFEKDRKGTQIKLSAFLKTLEKKELKININIPELIY